MWAKASISPRSQPQPSDRTRDAGEAQPVRRRRIVHISTGLFSGALAAQAVAGEFDAVGVVDQAVEDGIGIGWVGDELMPFVDRDLTGDDGGTSSVAFLADLEHASRACSYSERAEPVLHGVPELNPAGKLAGFRLWGNSPASRLRQRGLSLLSDQQPEGPSILHEANLGHSLPN